MSGMRSRYILNYMHTLLDKSFEAQRRKKVIKKNVIRRAKAVRKAY